MSKVILDGFDVSEYQNDPAVRAYLEGDRFVSDMEEEEENEGEEEKSLKFNPAHDSHGRFATGGSGGGSGGASTSGDFRRDDWLGMPMGDRRDAWEKLPISKRDKLADVANTVPRRVSELLGNPKNPPDTGNLSVDVSSRASQFRDKVGDEAATKIAGLSNRMADQLSQAGVDAKTARKLTMDAVDHLTAQEIEGSGRTLGDHGINHIAGDVDVAMQALDSIPQKTSAADRAAVMVAAVYHDTGYLAPPSQIFLDEGHPRWSAEYFDEKVRPMVEKALGKRSASEVSHIIRTHDAKDIDWNNDPAASAMRVGDNSALFHKEKLPPVLRDVPGNLATLSALGRKEIGVDEAKSRMRTAVEQSSLSDARKQRMMSAVAEVSPVLPKLTLGMMGGELGKVEWKGQGRQGHLALHLKERPEINDIQKVGDFGQGQFGKFAKTYDVDPDKFKTDLSFKFKSGGKTVLEGIWDKLKAIVDALRRKGMAEGMTEMEVRDVVAGLANGDESKDLTDRGKLLLKTIKDMLGE